MKPKILYFYFYQPTEEQIAEARELGAMLRDARHLADSSSYLEECDAVAGEVPPQYLGHQRADVAATPAPAPAERPAARKNKTATAEGAADPAASAPAEKPAA